VLDDVGVDVQVDGLRVVLAVADGARALGRQRRPAAPGGLVAQTAEVSEPSLDEVFLRLTGTVAA
jgi:hypothetical protein